MTPRAATSTTAGHHRDPRLVLLVALGGTVGTAARHLVSTATGSSVTTADGATTADGSAAAWPIGTFVANVVGALLLGVLLEALVRRGRESDRARLLRLGVGTGVLGGFTTFSTLALELERLLADGGLGTAALYGLGSVTLGFLACLLGVALAARHHEWRSTQLPRDPDAAGR